MEEIFLSNVDWQFKNEVLQKMCTEKPELDLNNCLTCGMCSAGCPFNGLHDHSDPRQILRVIALGLKDQALKNKFIWTCTMCGRCTEECPMDVDVATVIRTLRGNFGIQPPGYLQDMVDIQINTGNQMEVTKEDYLDTLNWIEKELQIEVGDPDAKIPVDKEGADFLFLWDPREIKYYPQDVQSIAKIFWYVGANWTCSSQYWDATHYALFNGNDEESAILMKRVGDEVKRLKVKEVVITECGHATRAQKWGPRVWTKDPFYPVRSIVEKYKEWMDAGLLHVDPAKNSEPVTLHDPCNMVRKEDMGDTIRYVLRQVVTEFREMTPHGKYNYCCGGGGGLMAMGKDIQPYRLSKGKLKADQIVASGCKLVVCPCHNCWDQLTDIIKHYKIDARLAHLHHLISAALIMEKRPVTGLPIFTSSTV